MSEPGSLREDGGRAARWQRQRHCDSRGLGIASIDAEEAGVAVVTVEVCGSMVAVREGAFADVWMNACQGFREPFIPRLLIAVCGPQRKASLEGRLDLQLLHLILRTETWCRWVDFTRVSSISTDASEIGIVCDWLEQARCAVRLADDDRLFTPHMLREAAPWLLEEEREYSELEEA